jgi:hypothetical protein
MMRVVASNSALGFVLVLSLTAGPALARDFRVETAVFRVGAAEPVSRNLTLFANGVVYDFLLTEPAETTVFDPSRGKFALIDHQRRLVTHLGSDEVVRFVAALESRAQEGRSRLRRFAARPAFQETYHAETERLTLHSAWIVYQAQGAVPRYPEAARQYWKFADWSARLNATRPGALSPAARLKLNRGLSQRGRIPRQVTVEIMPQSSQSYSRRSEHRWAWELTDRDRRRIGEAEAEIRRFRTVSFSQFRGLDVAVPQNEGRGTSRR